MYLISPTGKGIRSDSQGLGHYGAPRGNKKHRGIDFICQVGQNIIAPISGYVKRIAMPYANNKNYSGIYIEGTMFDVKIFYFLPNDIIKKNIKQGDIIGIAQDISLKYNKNMTPHIHLEVYPKQILNKTIDPMLVLKKL